MNIVLIGYMGSGKTAVGKALSTALGFSFLDLDDHIEKQESNTIQDLFATRGEIYFRRKESEALSNVLKENKKLVLSTGGGTPCYGNSMDFLLDSEGIQTVYLKASVDELSNRLFEERKHRPLISHLDRKDELSDFIRKHLFERAPVYERSTLVIPVDGKTIPEIVREIVMQLF